MATRSKTSSETRSGKRYRYGVVEVKPPPQVNPHPCSIQLTACGALAVNCFPFATDDQHFPDKTTYTHAFRDILRLDHELVANVHHFNRCLFIFGGGTAVNEPCCYVRKIGIDFDTQRDRDAWINATNTSTSRADHTVRVLDDASTLYVTRTYPSRIRDGRILLDADNRVQVKYVASLVDLLR